MKLIDVDSKATLEDFLTLKKTELVQLLRKCNLKISITRMSLRSDKDVETYLLKSRSDDNEKMSCYRQFIRGFNFYKENYIHDIMINMIDDDSKRCYIRSQCFPSMKTGKYSQWLLMTKENPIIISTAHCTCPAG